MNQPSDEIVIPLKAKIIGSLIYWLIRAWGATLRHRLVDEADVIQTHEGRSIIWALWHNGLFSLPMIRTRILRKRAGAAITSASKDGAVVSQVLRKLDIQPIRGSNSRRGGQALLELATWLERGYDIAITPDGPRGPKYKLSRGTVKLAQRTEAVVVPVSATYSRCWRLKSWDQFRIPIPFSRVDVHFGRPIDVPADLSKDEFEAYRQQIQDALMFAVPPES